MDFKSISPPITLKKYSKTLFIQPSSPKSPIPHLKDYLSYLKKNNQKLSNLKNMSLSKNQTEPTSISFTKSKNLAFAHDLNQTTINYNGFALNSKINNIENRSNSKEEIERRDKNKKFYFPKRKNFDLEQENTNFGFSKNENLNEKNNHPSLTQIKENNLLNPPRSFSKNQVNHDLSHFSKNNVLDYDLHHHFHLTKSKLKRNLSESITKKNEEFDSNIYTRKNFGNAYNDNFNFKNFDTNNLSLNTKAISPINSKNIINLNRCNNNNDFAGISKIHNFEELATNLKNIFQNNNHDNNNKGSGIYSKITNNSHLLNENSSNNATSHRNTTTIKKSDKTDDFHLRPTSFGETLRMIEKKINRKVERNKNLNEETIIKRTNTSKFFGQDSSTPKALSITNLFLRLAEEGRKREELAQSFSNSKNEISFLKTKLSNIEDKMQQLENKVSNLATLKKPEDGNESELVNCCVSTAKKKKIIDLSICSLSNIKVGDIFSSKKKNLNEEFFSKNDFQKNAYFSKNAKKERRDKYAKKEAMHKSISSCSKLKGKWEQNEKITTPLNYSFSLKKSKIQEKCDEMLKSINSKLPLNSKGAQKGSLSSYKNPNFSYSELYNYYN